MLRRAFLGVFAFAVFSASAQNIDITVVGKYKSSVPVYRVAVSSPNADMAALAKRAFGLHGSYKLVGPGQAQFSFNFEPAGENAVKLTIKGGTTYERVCRGKTSVEALMRACDEAVLRTVRTPGFFAGKLVFSYFKSGSNTSEICTSDMVFRSVRSVTRDGNESLMPHFSPDGGKILYTGYFKTGFMDLFEIDLSSNTRRTFASFKGSNTGGSFSPDGSKVALILTSSGNAEVWTANAKGGGFKRLTRTPNATESSPSFSPDGQKIVYASDSRGGPQIYIIPAAGGKPQAVPTQMSGYCSEPAWNPVDPTKIAFTAAVGKGFQIAVYDSKARSSKWISSGDNTSGAVWLNDGRHLVCTKSRGDRRTLYVIDSETGHAQPLHTQGFGNAKEADFHYSE